mgnify:CR=1 FL=1
MLFTISDEFVHKEKSDSEFDDDCLEPDKSDIIICLSFCTIILPLDGSFQIFVSDALNLFTNEINFGYRQSGTG